MCVWERRTSQYQAYQSDIDRPDGQCGQQGDTINKKKCASEFDWRNTFLAINILCVLLV